MKRETYVQAKARLLIELRALNWTISKPGLKFPWAKKDGHRLDFKAQAVYLDGSSLWVDTRDMKAGSLLELACLNVQFR